MEWIQLGRLVFRMNVSRDVGFPCLSWRTQHRPSKSLPFNIFPPCSLCSRVLKTSFYSELDLIVYLDLDS